MPSAVLRSVVTTAMIVLGFMAPWTLLPANAHAAGTTASAQAVKAAGGDSADEFSYSDLRAAIADKAVKSATLSPASFEAEVVLKDGSKRKVGYPPTDEALADELSAAGAKVKIDTGFATARSQFPWGALMMLGGIGAMIAAMFFLQRKHAKAARAGQDMQSKNAQKEGELPSVRFSDIAGCDEAVQEASELVDFLKAPLEYRRLGAKMPSGLMLYGPPGTGKTLLAKAVAGEAGAAFYAMSGSDFVEMFVGVGAARVRDVFAKARLNTPAIIFIDEVDAVGAKRGGGSGGGGGHREADQTLNQLLVEMDGFGGNERLLVIAATNRLDTLDPALLRPGRFSRHVHVGPPSEDGRLSILNVHAKGKPLAEDVDLPQLAKVTAGSSGAELAEMLNEGAIMAARGKRPEITHEDLFEGFLRVVAGPRKASAMLAAGEREAVAYHEAGHVLCAELCPSVDKTLHATINPRGQAAGFAVVGRSDRALHTAQHIHEQLIYILGGRAAEHVIYGTVSSGAANDLEKANTIARAAVEQYGLSPAVGQIVNSQSGFAEQTKATIDAEIRRIVEDAYRDAIAMVQEHREQLERLTQALLRAGDIDHLEIAAAMEGSTPAARRPNLQPLPDPEPEFVADLDDAPGDAPERRLWLPGRSTAGQAIAAFRSERDDSHRGPAARA
ncbi:ATP-dependent metallopeptidase FtsH/Yme1/Tma family protein [Solirubrobacter ginsenosidimutans]|uniref:ATP-dependent metallopeptidase FtsH/Yme1/Tma family protein n=1 Tax=Solirubrobacter ginsenosidimutans TaxID=490573 RepID=UPI0022CDE1BD|nr:AAA family ATPase [Solirubrobacter ginsenosidimutans]